MNFFDCVLDFLFPPVCGICLKRNGKSICDECRKIINYKSINKIEKYKKKYFYKHLYIFKYEGIIRQRLLEYKFKEKAYLYKTFAETIIHDKDNIEYIKKYDILIPVPIHKKRKKDRGYNQSGRRRIGNGRILAGSKKGRHTGGTGGTRWAHMNIHPPLLLRLKSGAYIRWPEGN